MIIECKHIDDKKSLLSRMMYGMRKAPPPFSYARKGNLQTLPRPTEYPTQERTNSAREPQWPRATSSSMILNLINYKVNSEIVNS